MLKVQVGSSVKSNSAEAGREAASQVKKDISSMKVALVYSGAQYDQKLMLDAISKELPGVALIGNTSYSGIITHKGYVSGADGFVGIMTLSDESLLVGVAGLEKQGDARSTGRKVAMAALKDAGKDISGKIDVPDYFYMTAPPGEEEFYLKGIEDIIGRVPFFGGSAADNDIAGDWLIFQDDMVTSDGVAVIFFYTNGLFSNIFTGAYGETTNAGIITKLNGYRTLVEIDGVPALKKYAEWTGKDPSKLIGGNLLVESVVTPLGVKDRLGDLIAIRHPMNGNDDFSINVGNNLAVNTAVIQMSGSVDKLIDSAGETIQKLKEKVGGNPSAYHLVHCGGRRIAIGNRIDELAKAVKDAAGDVPFILEFTFGEYGYEDDGNNTCGGLMLSFTALG